MYLEESHAFDLHERYILLYFTGILIFCLLQMEKSDFAIAHANKAKLRAYGYATAILAVLCLGLVVSNIMTFNYMYQRFANVS